MASKGIIELLTQDHREVDDLMTKIEKAEDEETCMELFAELRTSLLAHAQAEDEVFYTRLEEEADIETLIAEAREEHQRVEDLIEELGEIEDEDEWMESFQELKQAVQHHVKEEEGEIFPKAKQLLDSEDLALLAGEFTEIKAEEVEGLEAEGDEEQDEGELTKQILIERARARGVQGYSHMTKAQLLEALRR